MSMTAKKTGTEVQTTMLGSSVQFRIDYEQTKQLPIGKAIHSDVVSVGGHDWRIDCYPRGSHKEHKGEYLSIYLQHMSRTRTVKAIFQAFLMDKYVDKEGDRCATATKIAGVHEFPINNDCGSSSWGWSQFIKGSTLEKDCVTEGHIEFVCGIMVINDSPIPVPPSDIGIHLSSLLDHTDGTDVSFIVDGETFRAHRAVLAARSPVFRAELFGSMAEATMTSITLHEIAPATFKAMLR